MRAARLLTALIILLAGLLVKDVRGADNAPDKGPTETVRATVSEVLGILNDPALEGPEKKDERRARLREAAKERIDFGEMSRLALGKHWRGRSERERSEFVRLFSDLLENTYLNRIEDHSGAEVLYTGERRRGDHAEVSTTVLTEKGTEVPISYRLVKQDSGWVVYDIVIEGVSLVGNYRKEFGQFLHDSSFEDLLRNLESKAKKGGAAPPP